MFVNVRSVAANVQVCARACVCVPLRACPIAYMRALRDLPDQRAHLSDLDIFEDI